MFTLEITESAEADLDQIMDCLGFMLFSATTAIPSVVSS